MNSGSEFGGWQPKVRIIIRTTFEQPSPLVLSIFGVDAVVVGPAAYFEGEQLKLFPIFFSAQALMQKCRSRHGMVQKQGFHDGLLREPRISGSPEVLEEHC